VAFRVMAFNTMLLPPVFESGAFDPVKLLWGQGEDRARAIGSTLSKDPWPDVLALCEVWSFSLDLVTKWTPLDNQQARKIVRARLARAYPYSTPMLPDPIPADNVKAMDSGLLLMARRRPVPLRGQLPPEWQTADPKVGFALFDRAEGVDAFSSKGVGVVRFETDVGQVTIAFTHLQSAYDSVDQYSAVRAAQLDTIEALLNAAVGPQPWPDEEAVIVVGDFNIATIKNAGEYNGLFANPNLVWGTHFHDGWPTFNSPPYEDAGISQHSWKREKTKQQEINRLDYALVYDPRPPYPPPTYPVAAGTEQKVVAQHMRTTYRTLSDHYAVCTDLARWNPHCHPRDAYEQADRPPFLRFPLHDAGQMVWLRFDSGTYTFTKSDPLELTLYTTDDLSDPWPPYQEEKVDLSKIRGAEAAWHEPGLPPEGTKYSFSSSFLVRATTPTRWNGTAGIGWRRHRGESMLDAIGLRAHDPLTKTDFAPGRKLNDKDEQWYSIKPRRPFRRGEQDLEIVLENPSGKVVGLSLRASDGRVLAQKRGAARELSIHRRAKGGELLYVVVRRSRPDDPNVLVGWRTNLTLMHPHALRCDDETGWDPVGADEVTLTVSADGTAVKSIDWNEADTGETLGLFDASRPGIGFKPYAYLERAGVRVVEHDDDGDVTSRSPTIAVLGAQAATAERASTFRVGSGKYSFLYHLSHWLPGD
jgi:endonuclease/exonuclease/phosphatase family metal-dependent hydrolase